MNDEPAVFSLWERFHEPKPSRASPLHFVQYRFMSRLESQPLSPHLQVYRLPLTALLSVAHRLTGVVLALGMVPLTGILVAAATDAVLYEYVRGLLSAWWGQALLVLWSAALYFHLCNGVRHLFWDAGLGFDVTTAHRTSLWTLAATITLTALTWAAAFWVRGMAA